MIPISQTLPDVNLDEILAALDSDTRDYLVLLLNDGAQGLGLRAQGPRAGAGDPAPGADREVRARDQRGPRRAPANLARVVHNFSLLTDELGKTRHAARELRPELQRGLRHAGRPGRVAAADPAEAAGHAADDADDAGQGHDARRRARADARGAAPRGARARPVAAPDAAVPARVDADHPRRDPAVHARGAADGQGAAPRDARPGGGDARPDGVVQRRQPAAERRSPTTRRATRRRASSSGSRGSTTPATRSSPRRTRTARSAAAWSCCRARPPSCWTSVAQANPQLGTLVELLNAPTQCSRSARSRPRPPGSGGTTGG